MGKKVRVDVVLSPECKKALDVLRKLYKGNRSMAVEAAVWYAYFTFKRKNGIPMVVSPFFDKPDQFTLMSTREKSGRPHRSVSFEIGQYFPLEVEEERTDESKR